MKRVYGRLDRSRVKHEATLIIESEAITETRREVGSRSVKQERVPLSKCLNQSIEDEVAKRSRELIAAGYVLESESDSDLFQPKPKRSLYLVIDANWVPETIEVLKGIEMPPGVVLEQFGDELSIKDNEGWTLNLDPRQASRTHMCVGSPLSVLALLLVGLNCAVLVIDTDTGTEVVKGLGAAGRLLSQMSDVTREYAARNGVGTLGRVVQEEGAYEAILL